MRITVLGLGRMGAPMARNLSELGYEMLLYDRDPGRAARAVCPNALVVGSVAEAAQEANLALSMVPDDAAEELLVWGPDGLLAHLPTGAIHLCMSSISPQLSQRLARAHEEAGQGYVAAPVLGNPSAAAAQHLWIVVGGPEAQINRCRAVLDTLSRGITRVSPRPEVAHSLVLGANSLTLALVASLAEVLSFGAKVGYPSGEYVRLLNLALFKSPMVDAFGGLMVRRDHEAYDQTLGLAAQGLGMLLEAASELAVAMPMARALQDQVAEAQDLGLEGKDITVLSLIRGGEG